MPWETPPQVKIKEVPNKELLGNTGTEIQAMEKTPEQDILRDDSTLIAYVQGKLVIGIFEPHREPPLTKEHQKPTHRYIWKMNTISRLTKGKDSP